MEQNTIILYFVGKGSHEGQRTLILNANRNGTNIIMTREFIEQEESKKTMPVHYFVCNQRDKYDGIDVWSCVVPAANGNQKDRLKHFLRQMPQVSCPDLKGNETNEKVKNYPMNKRFVMVDLDEKTKQAAEHELSHTEAKIKIRSLYQDQDQRQLEELGWEMGLVPLGKSPEHIFVELSKMCSEIPEAILHTTTNEVAIMDRYIRKAEYLKHNDEVILKKIRDVWNYTYEPNSSFATKEAFRDYLYSSPERLSRFKDIVDNAHEVSYQWSKGKATNEEYAKSVVVTPKKAEEFKSYDLNEENETLEQKCERLHKIITEGIAEKKHINAITYHTKNIYKQMERKWNANDLYVEIDTLLDRCNKTLKKNGIDRNLLLEKNKFFPDTVPAKQTNDN